MPHAAPPATIERAGPLLRSWPATEGTGLALFNVAQIERGKIVNPQMETLLALAKALGVSVNELTGWSEQDN